MSSKEELRKKFLSQRHSLTEAQYLDYNLKICDRFFTTYSFHQINTLHIFLPAEGKREPDTWLIIDRLRREFPAVRLAVPKVNGESLAHIYFEGLHQLKKTRWGLWEPAQGVEVDLMKIDQVVVPLLVVDKTGHRLGYGKGFYDRFLAHCKAGCRKTGLSFFEPVETIPEIQDNDVRLSDLITPESYCLFA